MKTVKNVPASVRQKLLNKSRNDKRPFNELLQYYAMERFLYRLSQSSFINKFVLKGALMLSVWNSPEIRPTMDIDMLGIIENDEEKLKEVLKKIIRTEVIDDGLKFDINSIVSETITEDADYDGVRIRFIAYLETARINLQIDIGFGDIVYPEFEKKELPAILDFPEPSLYCYSKESAIAEKFEAIVKLGLINSRMKDFYDIWLLSRQYDFDYNTLIESVRLTFDNRKTELNAELHAFSDEFILLKQSQWKAFRRRVRLDYVPESFSEIIEELKKFLLPLIKINSDYEEWIAPGPWKFNRILTAE